MKFSDLRGSQIGFESSAAEYGVGTSWQAEIAAQLRDEIRAGQCRSGDRRPRVADLEDPFGVTTATAVYGVGILFDEELVPLLDDGERKTGEYRDIEAEITWD